MRILWRAQYSDDIVKDEINKPLETQFSCELRLRGGQVLNRVMASIFNDVGLMKVPLQVILRLGSDFNLNLEPNNMDSVLPRCNDNLLSISHSLIRLKSSDNNFFNIRLTFTRH